MGTLPNRPVVAIDIDGTIGRYHEHFRNFAVEYVGHDLPLVWSGVRGEFSDALGLEKSVYRDIKLSYRQGGQKRNMPVFEGAKEMLDAIRAASAEVWCCTTRPWQRLDNIDPDTREFFRRNGLEFDGVIFGEEKYKDLVEIVGADRVVCVLEDLPEQIVAASEVLRDYRKPIMRFGPHNAWWREQSVWYQGVSDLHQATKAILHKIEKWKEQHSMEDIMPVCELDGCTVPTPHGHGTERINIIPALDDESLYEHKDDEFTYRKCYIVQDRGVGGRWYFHHDSGRLMRCTLEHEFDPQADEEMEHVHGDWDAGGYCNRLVIRDGDADVCGFKQQDDDRGDFGMPALGGGASGLLPPDAFDVRQPHAPKLTGVSDTPSRLTQGDRVANIFDEAQALFRRKNEGYGEPTSEDLGSRGQFADMHRKWKRLRAHLWEGEPWSDSGETIEEVLMDLMGHIGLTIDFLREGK